MPSLFCIGASIRLGYQPFLKQYIAEDWHISGAQENCGDSSYILEKANQWIDGVSPDVILVNSGLHDLRFLIEEKRHQVPLETYEENLHQLFDFLKETVKRHVVWHTITPINQELYNHKKLVSGHKRIFHRFEKDVAAFNQVAVRVAENHDVPVIDLQETPFADDLQRYMLDDGIHYAASGYDFIAQKIAADLMLLSE